MTVYSREMVADLLRNGDRDSVRAYLMSLPDDLLTETCNQVNPAIESTVVVTADIKISDKDGNLIPLVWNQEQLTWLKEHDIDPERPDIRGRKFRTIVLKPRQRGFSTMYCMLLFMDACNHGRRRNVTMAHSLDTSEAIFNMVHTAYTNLPAHKKRPTKYSNRRELWFSDNDSRYFIGTAGTDNFGSGSTLHNVHKTERSKWKFADPQDLLKLDASTDAAALRGNIFIESTAAGKNHFEEEYKAARDQRDSSYTSRFFAWFQNDEYQYPVPAGFVFDAEDEGRRVQFDLSREQMYWYVETRKQFKELMPQEFPFTDEEAFLASSMAYFNSEGLRRQLERLESPEYLPLGVRDFVLVASQYPYLHSARSDGKFIIWAAPREDRDYILSCDVARGENPLSGDYNSAGVYDTQTRERVACIHGRFDIETYAQLVFELYQLFNNPLVAVERTGIGWSLLVEIRRMGIPAQRGRQCTGLYHHDLTLITGKQSPKPMTLTMGWETNEITKNFGCQQLNAALIGDYITIYDKAMIGEMYTFVRKPNGELGAEPGKYDDRVMEGVIAAALLALKFDPKERDRRREIKPVAPSIMFGRRAGYDGQEEEEDLGW